MVASSLRVVGTSRERGAEESRGCSVGLKLSTEAESTMSTGSWAARWNRGESGMWRSRVETLSWQNRSACMHGEGKEGSRWSTSTVSCSSITAVQCSQSNYY